MKLIQKLVFFVAVAGCTSTASKSGKEQHNNIFSQTEHAVECNLYSVAVMPEPNTDENHREEINCRDDNNIVYMVYNLPESLSKLQNGSTRIQVEANAINGYTMDLKNGPAVIVSSKAKEQLRSSRIGDFTAAVIRVIGNDGYQPANSAAQISDEVFGTKNDKFNLVSGYNSCSGGKTKFSACQGQNLVNGVLEITTAEDLDYVSRWEAENYVTNRLYDLGFDVTKCSNILYALPDAVNMGIAYGYYNDYLTVYKSPWESSPSAQIHELGHNFDFRHSNEGDEYEDQTCMMGYSYDEDETPRMCFNAAKSWYFKWYKERHITVNLNKGMQGKMISIHDYLKGEASESDHHTIAKVRGSYNDSYFLMYNRQEGINEGVREYGNEVVIVNQSDASSPSNVVDHLSANSQFTKKKFGNTKKTLVIKVCDIVAGTPDYAYVIVYLVGVNNDGSVDCPGECSDSITWKYKNKKNKDCVWVSSHPNKKKKKKLCKKKNVKKNCPKACDRC